MTSWSHKGEIVSCVVLEEVLLYCAGVCAQWAECTSTSIWVGCKCWTECTLPVSQSVLSVYKCRPTKSVPVCVPVWVCACSDRSVCWAQSCLDTRHLEWVAVATEKRLEAGTVGSRTPPTEIEAEVRERKRGRRWRVGERKRHKGRRDFRKM